MPRAAMSGLPHRSPARSGRREGIASYISLGSLHGRDGYISGAHCAETITFFLRRLLLKFESGKLLTSEHLKNRWILPMVLLVAMVCSRSIVSWPFPQNLALSLGLALLIVIWLDMQVGIIIWFVLSAVGNMFGVDLPGIPPLRTAHLILLMLLGVWIIQSYKEILAAIARFFSTGKNRLLLPLLGWITLSMVVGRPPE